MKRLLSISSSKLLLFDLILFVAVFTVMNWLVYALIFRGLERRYRIQEGIEATDILFVGSSHIDWDIDPAIIEKRLARHVVTTAVPGANIELRYEIVAENLRKNGHLPSLLIVEADKYAFNDTRYSPIALPIKSYYHRNILKSYLRRHLATEPDFFISKILPAFSVNSEFIYFAEKCFNKLSFLWSKLASLSNISKTTTAPASLIAPTKAPVSSDRTDHAITTQWLNSLRGISNQISPTEIFYFNQLIELVRSHPETKLVLLDTPDFDLEHYDLNTPRFDAVRTVFRNASTDRIRYAEVFQPDVASGTTYFYDATHLNENGRKAFTEKIADFLEAF